MSDPRDHLPAPSTDAEIDAFVERARAVAPAAEGTGRLLFALDATASREPTWDRACELHMRMYDEAAALGGLAVELAWYRGHGELRTSGWCARPGALLDAMSAVRCAAGLTQIGRVLEHAIATARRERLDVVVFVGDCMEESIDGLCAAAGTLGLLGVPVLVFQEGHDPVATRAFAEIARLSHGAHCRFDLGSASELGELLRGAAVYAAGGSTALVEFGRRAGGAALLLSNRLGGG